MHRMADLEKTISKGKSESGRNRTYINYLSIQMTRLNSHLNLLNKMSQMRISWKFHITKGWNIILKTKSFQLFSNY